LKDAHLHWSAKRRELLNWFRENAAPLAEAYEGAVRMLLDERFPVRIHFISHAVRDISDRLPYILDPQKPASHVQYAQHLAKIEPLWRLPQATAVDGQMTETDSVAIGSRVALLIDRLVDEHRKRGERVSHYERLFRYLMRNEPSSVHVNERLAQDFKKVREWFMDLTHLRATSAPSVDESELKAKFGAFEGMLHSFVGDFFTGTAELDEILRQANT
jgi:hypothetical protein